MRSMFKLEMLLPMALIFALGCSEAPSVDPIDGEDSKLDPSDKGNIPNGGSIGGGGGGGGGGNNTTTDTPPDPQSPTQLGLNPEDPNLPPNVGDFDPVSAAGRCDSRIYALDAVGTQTLIGGADATFNAQGKLLRRTTEDGTIAEEYTYGVGSRLTEYTRMEGETSISTTWTYNSRGLLTTRTTSSGEDVTEEISYTYDGEGRVATRSVRTLDGDALGEPEVFLFVYPDLLTRLLVRDSDGDGAYTEGTDAFVSETVFFIDGRINSVRQVSDPSVKIAYQYDEAQLWSGGQIENEMGPLEGGFAFVGAGETGLQVSTIRPWTFEPDGQLDGVAVLDRGEVLRTTSGQVNGLELYGSSRDTPVALIEFEGPNCDRTRAGWLELTRQTLSLACDSDVPCERVN
jgi:YD repeat-containing protein